MRLSCPKSARACRKPFLPSNSRLYFARHKHMGTTKSPFELKPQYSDFKKVEASRPDFDRTLPITTTKTPDTQWTYGKGANETEARTKSHVSIDPYASDRSMISNYKLLVSGIPRPVSFVSTVSKAGVPNLAPFSYFQVVDHDPPIFVIGFSGRPGRPKDTQRNLAETGECVINVVSDHFVEAANATSLDIPYETSEWGLSGLNGAPSETVKPNRLQEAVFSIEGKLLEMKELNYGSHGAGTTPGSLAIIQGMRFWVREDAINEARDNIDIDAHRPVVQLGGIQYGRVRETYELPRPSLATELAKENSDLKKFVEKKQDTQA
ncbi:flavoprotein oxygenase [Xylariales sp. PMI_506]|nr:flavoprotein oxygenase [Xylariales sp. PMI_506]